MIWIYSYSYNYLTHTLFVIHSAMALISVPVGPRPCYDSDVVYSLLKLVVAFRVYDKLCPSSWHRYFYLGGMWTGNSNRPYCREVKFSWRRKQLLEGKNKKIEDEKMILKLHVADVVDDHKIKMDAMRLKIRKIRKYAIHTEAWYHYAVGSVVTLVAIMIAFVFALKCFT